MTNNITMDTTINTTINNSISDSENQPIEDSYDPNEYSSIIPQSVLLYSQWAYVQVREFIEYYIPLSNNRDIHEVYPNLYIGNMSTVFNKELLKQKRIYRIVSAISGFTPPYPEEFKYYNVDALDHPGFNIKPFLNDACFFIENALKNQHKVYVHCMCGVSRSSTIIVAYLLGKMNKTPDEIIEYLQTIRPIVSPNPGFKKQLREYANE